MQKTGKKTRKNLCQLCRKKPLGDLEKFPYLQNKFTISHIRKSKVMFVMRGLPGSGKTFLSQRFKSKYKSVVVCSADEYFYHEDGSYHHEVEKLAEAHEHCKKKAEEAAARGDSHIVIDNTNIRRWEMGYYFSLAGKYDYIVIIVLPQTPWQFEPALLQGFNKHGCCLEYLEEKKKAFQEVFPFYWGWFLNEVDSKCLTMHAEKYFAACIDAFPEFQRDLAEYYLLAEDHHITFKDIYNIKESTILHCTAFYAGGRGDKLMPGTKEYADREAVKRSTGKTFLLSVVSFVFTPRTAGTKIDLNGLQMKLWGSEDIFCYKYDEKGHKIPSDPQVGEKMVSRPTATQNSSSIPSSKSGKKKKVPTATLR